ncbi:MAG: hypothetical protein A3I05_08320 [Deltaproteobacteria bacterium RIFCSPLOWO2_02_FULL_44_10]|nr:MAG: hypothetical protein A3I05_08320 [Deltaproteobacteria bacterium RIFCSPLOWO2_02_FULL_44_10]
MSLPLPNAIVAVIEKDGRYLFVRRSYKRQSAPGYWTPPSGRMEPGETEEQAVEREMKEELGLLVRPIEKIFESKTHDSGYRLHWWKVQLIEGEATCVDPENTECRWVTLVEMEKLFPVFEEDIDVFQQLEEGKKS